MSRVLVSAGDRYGQLMIVRELELRRSAGSVKRWFLCQCKCGKECEVRMGHLRSGHTNSCGCLVVTPAGTHAVYHGMEDSPEYHVWRGVKQRCYRKRARGYANYGGRGIKMCDRWRQSFKAFIDDMGARPSPEHQLDRYPNQDGDYEPGNVRWATRAEQNRNRKDNVMLEFRGERMCLTDWAKRAGMTKGTLRSRLLSGMTIQEALTTPVRQWTHSS